MKIESKFTAPWGQDYFWSIDEQTFRVWTTAKTGGSRDQSFPAGLAWSIAIKLCQEKLRIECNQFIDRLFNKSNL
jgi:hypothetical protein